MIANARYEHEQIKQVIIDQLNTGVLTNYAFPTTSRVESVQFEMTLFSTGAESIETAMKIDRL